MNGWGGSTSEPVHLTAEAVLDQMETAVVVTDRLSNLLYTNDHAARLFAFPPGDTRILGRSVLTLIEEEDHDQAIDLARQVLRGGVWEGTFSNLRHDGSRIFVRAQAIPLRHPSGSIDGVVILARRALARGTDRDLERVGLLDRIGERLSGSLELDVTLERVAEMLVPNFADHCMIDLFTGDKLVRKVSVHTGHWQPPQGTWAAIDQEITYPRGHFAHKAIQLRDSVVVEDVEELEIPAPSEASGAVAHDVGVTSVISAPLIARGELLGVLNLALSGLTQRSPTHYDGFDRDLVGAISGRVAIAIDNAMLFEEERRTAIAFQKSLLPTNLPELDGLEMAHRYVPAKPLESHGQGIQTQVGGDWYDVIPLSAGRVGIVIGDVEGRGAGAAAIMGQLRAALRAFAQDDKSPAEILRKLDEWCRGLGRTEIDSHGRETSITPMASCMYLVYDAWSRKLSVANAGHDAPLMVLDGKVARLETAHKGVLLGVRAKGIASEVLYEEETIALPPGAALVLYTDGLTDRRTRADGRGYYTEEETFTLLCRSIAAAAAEGSVEAIAEAAEHAVPGDIDDDMAILVVRSAPTELAVRERTFPAEPIMVSEARRMAAEAFGSWEMDREQAELACLLVSEVVTNVVLHAAVSPTPRRELVFEGAPGGSHIPGVFEDAWDLAELAAMPAMNNKEFRLRLRRGASSIWVEVFDSDLRLPRIRSAGENDEGGRGLYLVEQLATRWGSRPTKDGKAVWFEMPVTGGTRLD